MNSLQTVEHIAAHKRDKWREAGEDYVMRSFNICALHEILL
jgi:hypothetical protein